ncbi:MAG: Integration host factor subunit beta [Alphaproteobacteria bacterium MarineAlpha5_Bin9]|nr:MAG: Integration host factor subunit beta [Alphaproteobacteria bacterium MarineAlpha5_Bin9]|tara:strand:+ start:1043 stop:1327 length:285 start_codon:yes stop_codon:yes gene_type:complete
MLKSDLIVNLQKKYKSLSTNDTERIIELFFNKITSSLSNNNNVEIRFFGSFKNKINKAKYVRNPKTNEKIYKEETKKIHFKIGKILHKRLNSTN